jgi:hypothetical protein
MNRRATMSRIDIITHSRFVIILLRLAFFLGGYEDRR